MLNGNYNFINGKPARLEVLIELSKIIKQIKNAIKYFVWMIIIYT